MSTYYYDSYAIIEYISDNPSFISYFEEHTGILTLFTLSEVYYSVLRESGLEKAEIIFETVYPLVVPVAKETLKKAMQLRFYYKALKLSYADAIGYQVALERNIPFLTGDKAFKNLPAVEFKK